MDQTTTADAKDASVESVKVIVTVGGETTECEYRPGESLLETALRADVNAPYSCMEGVCTACMAKLEEGEIDFPEDTILSEEDAAEGKTLTCQAKVKKGCSRVVVNYDAI